MILPSGFLFSLLTLSCNGLSNDSLWSLSTYASVEVTSTLVFVGRLSRRGISGAWLLVGEGDFNGVLYLISGSLEGSVVVIMTFSTVLGRDVVCGLLPLRTFKLGWDFEGLCCTV